MTTEYSWDDLKSYFKENTQFPEVYEKLLREEEKRPAIKDVKKAELSGVLFCIDWDSTPKDEGRYYWHNIYKVLLEQDRKIAEIKA